jgi:hypothetical protein
MRVAVLACLCALLVAACGGGAAAPVVSRSAQQQARRTPADPVAVARTAIAAACATASRARLALPRPPLSERPLARWLRRNAALRRTFARRLLRIKAPKRMRRPLRHAAYVLRVAARHDRSAADRLLAGGELWAGRHRDVDAGVPRPFTDTVLGLRVVCDARSGARQTLRMQSLRIDATNICTDLTYRSGVELQKKTPTPEAYIAMMTRVARIYRGGVRRLGALRPVPRPLARNWHGALASLRLLIGQIGELRHDAVAGLDGELALRRLQLADFRNDDAWHRVALDHCSRIS